MGICDNWEKERLIDGVRGKGNKERELLRVKEKVYTKKILDG